MDKPLVRILVWLSLMAVLTLLTMGGWLLAGGDTSSVTGLKWLQLLQTVATFLVPSVVGAWLWSDDHSPFRWLKLTNHKNEVNRALAAEKSQIIIVALATMICALPAINLLADLNSRVVLPDCMAGLEATLRAQEEAAARLTERFLQADDLFTLLINIGLMALLPALAEEITFRGTLQQIISPSSFHLSFSSYRTHLAIWLSAIVFSAIHLQFYGFVPRMLMGAMFGYVFVWSGSLWLPVLMHATNNTIAVVTYYIAAHSESGRELLADNRTWADTIGTGPMWWLGVVSLLLTLALLFLIRKKSTAANPANPSNI